MAQSSKTSGDRILVTNSGYAGDFGRISRLEVWKIPRHSSHGQVIGYGSLLKSSLNIWTTHHLTLARYSHEIPMYMPIFNVIIWLMMVKNNLVGGWATYPSEKIMKWKSVGMTWHSQLFLESRKIPWFQSPPTRNISSLFHYSPYHHHIITILSPYIPY